MLAHVTYAAQQWHRVQALVDTHIHASARGVLEALARHDCGPALAWCEANRPRLRKQKSKLEFKLRVQARPPLDPVVLTIIAVLSLVCTRARFSLRSTSICSCCGGCMGHSQAPGSGCAGPAEIRAPSAPGGRAPV